MMKAFFLKKIFTAVLSLCCVFLTAQSQTVDSIVRVIKEQKIHDTTLIKLYNRVGELVYSYQPDSAIHSWERAAAICEEKLQNIRNEKEKRFYIVESSASLNNIGYVYQNTGDALLAIKYLKKSLLLSMMIDDYSNVAIALNNIGHNLANIGNNVGALDYYNQNLEVVVKHGTKKELINSLVVLGDMYAILQDENNAVQYMNKARLVAEEINDKSNIAYTQTLLGNVYFRFLKYKDALIHDSISLSIYKELKNDPGIATAYNNIGARNYALQRYQDALTNFEESLAVREKLNDLKGTHSTLLNIGTTLNILKRTNEGFGKLMQSLDLARKGNDKILEWSSLKQISNSYLLNEKNYVKSEEFGLQALNLARQLGFPEMIRTSAKLLTDIYLKKGDYRNAFEMQKLYLAMHDSLVNVQTRKATINSQLKYEYEIKAAADSVRTAAEKKLSSALLSQEKTKSYALYGGLALTLLFGGFMFNRYKKTNRQRIIIEQKERETNYQKALVENKNKEILDSIAYAKRLQDAILPPASMWKNTFDESFIFFKPKDIVAGDFYWMELGARIHETNEASIVYFTAADCTGHGVPGAMVSVVCANALTRTVNEFQINEPGKILDKVRELVIQTFEKSESEVKDGMDISLCSLNRKTFELKWAGANNPLWIVRKNAAAIEEIKGDKQPVGVYAHSSPFKTHVLQLEKGDCIYIFTDGFADQFGGERGKKFKSAKMKELLLSFRDQPMNRQFEFINEAYEKWRGGFEQIDDVCVIGVRV